MILSFGACADALTESEAEAIAHRLAPGDWLLLQGNLSATATASAMRQAKARGASVMFNPAPLRWNTTALLPLCDVVVANAVEALEITGATFPQAASTLHQAGAALAIVTAGAAGCASADATGLRTHPAIQVTVLDTTGAGDTVCGVLAAKLMTGTPPDAAIQAAMRAASLTVQRPGAYAALPGAAALCEAALSA